jgi:hypothetical protein
VRIKGAARYSTGNSVWQPLKVGTILKTGYIVQTAKDSFADVALNEEAKAQDFDVAGPDPDGGITSPTLPKPPTPAVASARAVEQDVIRILEDSLLSFDRLSAVDTGADRVTETEIDLRTGAIFGAVKKQAAASRFEVKIPNGVAGIRGTYFYASAKGIFSCLSGSLVAGYTIPDPTPTPGAKVVGAGFQFNCLTGEMSPISAPLLSQFDLIGKQINAISQQRVRRGRGWTPPDRTVFPVSRHNSSSQSTPPPPPPVP